MYNKSYADFAVNFISCLKHVDGEWYGVPFTLLDWQEEAVRELYGTLRNKDTRTYQYLYLEIPKKNGKSELAAALGLYHLFADGEMNGEVYVCAADRKNAGIIFKVALGMLNQCQPLKKRAKIKESTKEIIDTVSGTVMQVMSSEAFSKHGYKPSCVIFDELHTQPNRELWDVMTFGAGSARKQPVWIVLTTAGKDPDRNSIGWEVHEQARKILAYRKGDKEGNYDNPIWLPYIYGMPDDPDEAEKIDIYDEQVWYKYNPSLGKTISIDTLRQEALDAKQNAAKERLFRWLRLNQWISVHSVGWLPLTLYDKTNHKSAREELRQLLHGLRCYGGLDLSSTTDLTAYTLLFPPQEGLEHWVAIYDCWIPSEAMLEREERDHVPYTEWVQEGHVHATDGDVIDYDVVEAHIRQSTIDYEVQMIGTDQWNSRMLTQHLTKDDISIIEISQTMSGMSPAMKETERLLRKKLMQHEKNPCARWNFGNVRCAVDGNENIKPMKNKSTGRIDITVSWINAMATAMINEKADLSEQILSGEWSM